MKRLLLLLSVAILALSLTPSGSQATLIWDWNFTPAAVTAVPTDDIGLFATLYNDAASDQDITSSLLNNESVSWGLPFPYSITWGTWPGDILTVAPLHPGQSLTYLFGTLTHIGIVPDGTYVLNGGITLNNYGHIYRDFTINVSSVPEPSTLLLLGSGMAGFAAMRLRKLRKGV